MAILLPITISLRDGSSVQLRSAAPEDAADFLRLAAELAEEGSYGTVAGTDDPRPDLFLEQARFESDAVNPATLQLVAIAPDGRLLGEARCDGMHRARIRHVARVSISIRRDARGVGLGEALMRRLIAWAEDHPDIERLTLAVFEPNIPARRLYEKLGFVTEGVRYAEIRLAPGRYANDIIMAMWVKPRPSTDMLGGLPRVESWRDHDTDA